MEYQCLIRECQIYKTYTILLGIVVGCSIFFFRFNETLSLIIGGGFILADGLFAALLVNHYNAMYKAYPGIYEMKSSWLWYVIYALIGGIMLYAAVHPQISRLSKAIIIGIVFSYVFQHPMRGIKKYIRKNTRR